jgi:hypothetical protein
VICGTVYGQNPQPNLAPKLSTSDFLNTQTNDTLSFSKSRNIKAAEATIDQYQLIDIQRDTIVLDTSLHIDKEFKFNELRRDMFGLLALSNDFQGYNELIRTVDFQSSAPALGAKAKQYGYFEKSDMRFYRTATPLTELMFRTTLEKGQFLDAVLATNLNPRLNISLEHRGFRSQGQYDYQQSESGAFRTTISYNSKDEKYVSNFFYTYQDYKFEENGGITKKELQFESGDPEFLDRSRIDILHTNAKSRIVGRAFYYDQSYQWKSWIRFNHELHYDSRFFQFQQDAANSSYGGLIINGGIDDKIKKQSFENNLNITLKRSDKGAWSIGLKSLFTNYFTPSKLITSEGIIPNQLKGQDLLLRGKTDEQLLGHRISVEAELPIQTNVMGKALRAELRPVKDSLNFSYSARINYRERAADFQYQMYQSDYENFNWYNEASELQKLAGLKVDVSHKKWGSLQFELQSIEGYRYFAVQPSDEVNTYFDDLKNVGLQTADKAVQWSALQYHNRITRGKWGLDVRLHYQQILQGNTHFALPDYLGRVTLYYSSDIFQKAMFIQTGIRAKYFEAFQADAYHPVLGSMFRQNKEVIGGYPLIDLFINAKVKRTRIYFKAQHVNSSFTGFNYYAAPQIPHHDFVIRFGLIWNFFS